MRKLQFLNITDPDDANSAENQQSVRAHVGRYQWDQNRAQRDLQRQRGRRRRTQLQDVRIVSETGQESSATTVQDSRFPSYQPSQEIERPIGGLRGDPFQVYPIPSRPYFQAVIDHYMVHMAVSVPQLDGPDHVGLLRTSWTPLAFSEAGSFIAVILLAAARMSSLASVHSLGPVKLLELKQETLGHINMRMGDLSSATSDTSIGAVAKMVSYESMYGDVPTYQAHMRGLKRMVQARQGLGNLGLNGFLARFLIWIDLNAAFITSTARFLAEEELALGTPLMEPDPGHFIGSFGAVDV